MNHNLFAGVLPSFMSSAIVTATSTDYISSGLDMRGYEGVAFVAHVTKTNATTSALCELHLEQSDSSGFTTAIDVADSAAYLTTGFVSGTAAVLISDVFRPSYRWVRGYISVTSSGETLDSWIAYQYRAGSEAVSFSTADNICDVTLVVGTSGSATG